MKCNYVGNSSQSIVSVPNFFLMRKFKNIDTFSNNNPSSKNYFSEKKLFGKVREMNFSHNQRNNHREFEEYNRKRSYPRGRHLLTKISSSLNSKDFPVNVKIPEELHEYNKFTQYMNKLYPEKKNERVAEIKTNISKVIATLDPNFHKKKSEESFPTQLDTLHSSSQNEFKTKINYYKILTESEKFQQSIDNKILNLSKNNFLKLKKSISRDYNETQAKFAPKLTMSSDLIPKIHKILKNPLFESESDLGKPKELKEQSTFKSSFKLDIPTNTREPITTDVHFQFRKRKIEDEMLINIEKYHSKAIKENIQQRLKTTYFGPFYN